MFHTQRRIICGRRLARHKRGSPRAADRPELALASMLSRALTRCVRASLPSNIVPRLPHVVLVDVVECKLTTHDDYDPAPPHMLCTIHRLQHTHYLATRTLSPARGTRPACRRHRPSESIRRSLVAARGRCLRRLVSSTGTGVASPSAVRACAPCGGVGPRGVRRCGCGKFLLKQTKPAIPTEGHGTKHTAPVMIMN